MGHASHARHRVWRARPASPQVIVYRLDARLVALPAVRDQTPGVVLPAPIV